MARQILVLVLVLITIVGMVSADTVGAAAPGYTDVIGKNVGAPYNGEGGQGIVEGRLDNAVNAISGAATGLPPSSSGATIIGLSAIAKAVAITGYFIF
ncbi:hypothetical protein E1A91_A06G053700v1 [Gossypium mustelinum]|uniref:Uncharacterized protein n=3 Tax=Gossypium TaxID=3633 RepID=A0A2P5W7C7_GOSBA|nr:hypothetical protein ES319_A06G055000v1 [Gossypium barbadense]PPR87010.1 hypothetical protein GOBAR_AA33685 [Gossypium barbadense]TYH12334.1 hypothetical protein ES288_A06G059600v1 [Gossypium darwinii]TYJ29188.1 hypothetical protein E1A91_A06G053700v1 [Gossypium mustelinum]